ncbi:MAG TPA: META domain-containing protein [Salinimicrobium sp.]|nr:META domain-containing protein [Salinimicrobium sp.]
MKFKYLWCLSLFLLLFACNDSKKASVETAPVPSISEKTANSEMMDTTIVPSELEGIWVLNKLNKETIKNKTSAKNPTLHINPSEGTVMGNGGCNRYDGKIHFMEEKQIKIDPVKTTKMACGKLELEIKYFEALTGGTLTYIIEDKKLTLYRDGTTMILEKAD